MQRGWRESWISTVLMSESLTIARRKESCAVLGPGKRAVIWFHGCSRGCPGCIAKEMNESARFTELSPEELYAWLAAIPEIEGVTLSGGEPLEQDHKALLELLHLIKDGPRKLTVMCYSGWRLEKIKESFPDFLSCIDILIDGEYIQEQDDGMALRGSANQRIHLLSAAYTAEEMKEIMRQERGIEIELGLEGQVMISGIPRPGFADKFRASLRAKGLNYKTE